MSILSIFPKTVLGWLFLLLNVPVFIAAGYYMHNVWSLSLAQTFLVLITMFATKLLGFGEGHFG